mgnify:FL=1
MEENKFFKVTAPNGYEIDEENSTFENIVFKKTEQGVKTWEDLIGEQMSDSYKWIDNKSYIRNACGKFGLIDKNVFVDERHAKSALAMAQISQLMPYFGGSITNEEWKSNIMKYCIARDHKNLIYRSFVWHEYHILAFHTEEQRNNFIKYNKQLINDYLMLG